jgi:hypothetical protein
MRKQKYTAEKISESDRGMHQGGPRAAPAGYEKCHGGAWRLYRGKRTRTPGGRMGERNFKGEPAGAEKYMEKSL